MNCRSQTIFIIIIERNDNNLIRANKLNLLILDRSERIKSKDNNISIETKYINYIIIYH